MRITCAGLSTVDLVHRVTAFPGPDRKAQATSAEIAAGGPALNAAVTAAVLGADVTLVTVIGAHPLGAVIRDDLDRYGVRVVDAAPDSATPPPVSAVTVEESTGRRTIVSHNAAGAGVPAPRHDHGGVVLVDGHHPALARAAAAAADTLVVDAGHWRPVFADVLPYAQVVAASAGFEPPPGTVLATVAPHVAVTDGPRPVRWWSGTVSGVVPVPTVDARDTAGAGDAFHGALAVAVARGDGFEQALAYAVEVAAIRVQHAGPRAWLADPRLPR